jgi:hypothetical protein
MRHPVVALLLLVVHASAAPDELVEGQRFLAQNSHRLELKSLAQAFANGNAAAAREIGFMYYRGNGVRQDDAKAIEWFKKAAERGDLQSQVNLGQMYENGLSVPQSSEESARWFQAAANQGDRWSQFRMGEICYLGTGIPADRAEAAKWWYLALRVDDRVTVKLRATVDPAMARIGQEERDEGRRRADAWLAIHTGSVQAR